MRERTPNSTLPLKAAPLAGHRLLVVRVLVCAVSVALTFGAFRFGLPPKHGLPLRTVFWFPIALPILMSKLPLDITLCAAVFQFPAAAAIICLDLGRLSWRTVILRTFIAYAACVLAVLAVVLFFVKGPG